MTLAGLKALGYVPDVLFDQGAFGIEPLVAMFGGNPKGIVNRIKQIIKKLASKG